MAQVLNDRLPVLSCDCGQLQIRTLLAEQLQPRQPLLDVMIPVWQQQPSG